MTPWSAVSVGAWSRRPAVRDGALAFALLTACALVNGQNSFSGDAADPFGDGPVELTALWWAATALAVAAVALRRRWPVPMLAVAVLSAAIHVGQNVPLTLIDLSVPILLFTVATCHERAVSLAALAALVLVITGWGWFAAQEAPLPSPRPPLDAGRPALTGPMGEALPYRPEPERPFVVLQNVRSDIWGGLPMLATGLFASWAMGAGARNRRAYLDQLHARARELERERDQQAALAVAAERGRISRELHDVVAHGLSVMVIQAQGGAAALDHRPADTRSALAAIVTTGRDSLADMRRVLAAVGEVDDAWHPQPGLGQLPALLTQVRTAGTPVRLQVEGEAAPLPSTVDLSAYRIVQEALTNTMKHAGPGAAAVVNLIHRDTEVIIEVSDDGRGTVAGGSGLRGMGERVRLLGGRLATGPGPQGGFVVRAALPIQGRGA